MLVLLNKIALGLGWGMLVAWAAIILLGLVVSLVGAWARYRDAVRCHEAAVRRYADAVARQEALAPPEPESPLDPAARALIERVIRDSGGTP